eukprot:CFRG6521T1
MDATVKREELRIKYADHINVVVGDLPPHIRRVLTGKDVKQLSYVLLDPKVYATMIELNHNQTVEMRRFSKKREALGCDQETERNHLTKIGTADADMKAYDNACIDDLRQLDCETIHRLDALVVEQQIALGQLKVPGFWVTNDKDVIQVQIALLSCLTQLMSGKY